MELIAKRPILLDAGGIAPEGGVFTTDEQHGRQLLDKGYARETAGPEGADKSDPAKFTVPELKTALDAAGVTFKASASKAELLALLPAA